MPSRRYYTIFLQLFSLATPIFTFQQITFSNNDALQQKRRMHGSTSIHTSLLAHKTDNIILPIFPLRKRVKFPTEQLKLTLWEERYKMLSRYVLGNASHPDKPMFGALYCSHKTQIIKAGQKPITPMVEVGDVGIICSVTSSQVFINGEEVCSSRKDEEDVEKIRLWGLGVARFRVDRVISNGLGEQENKKEGSLPFILVEGSRIDDVGVFGDAAESDKVQTMLKQLLDRDDYEFDEGSLFDDEYAYTFREGEQRTQIQQMLTFALTSRLEATAPANEMLDMLSCTSTLERLEYLDRKLPRGNRSMTRALKFLFS
jgi:hypothetical protein